MRNKIFHFGEVLPKKKTGKTKEVVAKLSRGLMLPIAMLPIAGLALGIGATINSQSASLTGQTIGNVLMLTGNIIFAILPLLFAIAISITFTKDSGTAALSSVVGYFVFLLLQTSLIINPHGSDSNYHFLWYNFTPEKFDAIFAQSFGFNTLSTSVFGGILVGAIVAYLYNRFKDIQLPYAIGFFSGVRFIPIITFATMVVFSMFFAMIWPLIGQGLFLLGEGLQYGGKYGGVNSLIYGIFNRALVPFGMHHVVNTMLWFSNIGGQFDTGMQMWKDGGTASLGITAYQLANDVAASKITGDINMQIYFTRLIGEHTIGGQKYIITIQDIIYSSQKSGVTIAPGQYTNFAYIFGLLGLSGAALGMLFAAPKGENRKQAAAIVIPGAIVSSLTGVSEALEFTFLFLAPWLFWGFHAVLAGIGGMITTTLIYYAPNVAPHVTFSFAQGALDFVIYGIIPDARGGGTHCWMLLLMSIIYFPIYFGVFYWAIKKWNLATPGRGGTKLFSKKDWIKEKDQKFSNKALSMREKSNEVIKAYGGASNILNIDACITKLRVQVKDKKKVNEQRLKDLGALGVTHPSAQSVYAVFGNEADLIKNQMKDIIANGESPNSNEPKPLKH